MSRKRRSRPSATQSSPDGSTRRKRRSTSITGGRVTPAHTRSRPVPTSHWDPIRRPLCSANGTIFSANAPRARRRRNSSRRTAALANQDFTSGDAPAATLGMIDKVALASAVATAAAVTGIAVLAAAVSSGSAAWRRHSRQSRAARLWRPQCFRGLGGFCWRYVQFCRGCLGSRYGRRGSARHHHHRDGHHGGRHDPDRRGRVRRSCRRCRTRCRRPDRHRTFLR